MSIQAQLDPSQVLLGVVIFAFAIFLTMAIVFTRYARLWLMAFMSGASVGMFQLVGMTFRKVNPKVIVQAKIMAVQGGLEVNDLPAKGSSAIGTYVLEAHYLAGGNVTNVVKAMIVAQRAQLDLDFPKACLIDLSGRDVLAEVRDHVSKSGKGTIV